MLKKVRKKCPGSVLLSIIGICSGLRPILHPSFVEIHLIDFVLTDQPTNRHGQNLHHFGINWLHEVLAVLSKLYRPWDPTLIWNAEVPQAPWEQRVSFSLSKLTLATVALCWRYGERYWVEALENMHKVTSFGLSLENPTRACQEEIHWPVALNKSPTGLYRQPREDLIFHVTLWSVHIK